MITISTKEEDSKIQISNNSTRRKIHVLCTSMNPKPRTIQVYRYMNKFQMKNSNYREKKSAKMFSRSEKYHVKLLMYYCSQTV